MINQDYKNAALAALKGNWAQAVLASIVFMLITMAISGGQLLSGNPASTAYKVVSGSASFLVLFVLLPLEVGFCNAFVKLFREGDSDILHNSFSLGFSGWGHKVWTMFLMGLVIFCGILLLVIPGIILSFAYSMVPYLLVKHPELSASETLKASRMMMRGHKFDYFYLSLSFIGWIMLGLLTLGIGYFWLIPYMQTAISAFWEDVYNQSRPDTAK